MKKQISILLFFITISLFSSCVVNVKDLPDPEDFIPVHNITLRNNTSEYVTDWYVKNKNDKNFTKSNDFTPVKNGSKSTIYDLFENKYCVVFSFEPYPDYCDYYFSDYFYLDKNIEYKLSEYYIPLRSATNEKDPQLYLEDSDGNKIALHRMEIK